MVAIAEARHAAQHIIDLLGAHCERIEIAGSIRRGKPDPKDAELVAIPKSSLLAHMDALVERGELGKALYPHGNQATRNRWGNSYRGLQVGDVKVELFLATPETWGYIYWLRTGPGDANQWVMQFLKWQDAPCRPAKGAFRYDGELVPTPTEHDVFALLGINYIPPQERAEAAYKAVLRKGHVFPTPRRVQDVWEIGDPFPLDMLPEFHALREYLRNCRGSNYNRTRARQWLAWAQQQPEDDRLAYSNALAAGDLYSRAYEKFRIAHAWAEWLKYVKEIAG